MLAYLKAMMPRGLYGRAALILIVPIVTIQLVVSIGFIQRFYENVTRQMTQGVVAELQLVLAAAAADRGEAGRVAQSLGLALALPADWQATADASRVWDLSGRVVIETLHRALPELVAADLQRDPGAVRLLFATPRGPLAVTVDRRRVAASNPHQLLVLMILTSILMTIIAYLFLRNQIRPIKKLAEASEAFGKGRHLPYRPRGATEVRAAGAAFLEMRARIERQIEQRTLMLSGVSHDLRTPLTRLRLGLALLSDADESAALLGDVADMERLVDEFLAFARGDAMEAAETVDVAALVRRVVENAQRAGQAVVLRGGDAADALSVNVRLRPAAVVRALENLLGNAVRYGSRAEIALSLTDKSVRIAVEDDGPGIPKGRRDEAVLPFARLDLARDPNRGGGVGLGLAIAADIALSHGGALRLGQSEALGGLKAELVLAR